MARRAMRNRQFIGYTVGPFERNVRGRPFESERGGLSNFIWTDNYFRRELGRGLGNLFTRKTNVCSPLH